MDNFWRLLRTYCLNSTIVGLKYFYIYPDILSRCFWTVNMISVLAMSFSITYFLYNRFEEMPTRVAIENQFEPIKNLPYPAITLCTPNQVTISSLEYFKTTLIEGNKTDLESYLPLVLGFYEYIDITDQTRVDLKNFQDLLEKNRYTVKHETPLPRQISTWRDELRCDLMAEWQQRLSQPRAGLAIIAAVSPFFEEWLERRHGVLTYRHEMRVSNSSFGRVLFLIGREETPGCHHCEDRPEDTMGHTVAVPELLGRVPQLCAKFLKRCYLERKVYNCTDLFKPILTARGYCCTFNNNYMFNRKMNVKDQNFVNRTVKATGFINALIVVTDYEIEDSMLGTLLNAGAVPVMYTDYTEFPSDDELSYIESYGESFHTITATYTYCSDEVKSLPVRSRNCFFHDEHRLDHFWSYHNSDCDHLCYANAVKSACRCIPAYIPHSGRNNVCKLVDIPCIIDVKCNEGLVLSNSTSAFHFFFTNPVYLKQKQETVMSIISLACPHRTHPTHRTHSVKLHQYASHVSIAEDAVRTMRISGRSCMSFYTRQTKIRCVRCWPVDAYLKRPPRVHDTAYRDNNAFGALIGWFILASQSDGRARSRFDLVKQMPIIIAIENQFEPMRNLPYPAITLCTPNQVTVSALEYFKIRLTKGNTTNLESYLPLVLGFYEYVDITDQTRENLKIFQDLLDQNKLSVPELLGRVPQQCVKFLKRCYLERKVYNCTDLFKPILTARGYCCTFNNNYMFNLKMNTKYRNFINRTVKATGIPNALIVVTDYEMDDSMNDTLLNAGAVPVMYTDWTEFPSDDELSYIESYGESFHTISATYTYCSDEVKSLPVRSRNCFFHDELRLDHFWSYHNSDCDHLCYANAVKRVCNCTPAHLPDTATGEFCKLTDIPCVIDVKCKCPVILCISEGLVLNSSTSTFYFFFTNAAYLKQKRETVMSIISLACEYQINSYQLLIRFIYSYDDCVARDFMPPAMLIWEEYSACPWASAASVS
uniref:SFRICE_012692 n=1 Tax=Spodoptera frugiperda TaxID=7108 RepID=A0A2H1VKW3_SPOFR